MSVSRRRMLMSSSTGPGKGETGVFISNLDGREIIFNQGPVIYDNGVFRLQTSYDEACSYQSIQQLKQGSTYFTFDQIKTLTIDDFRVPSYDDVYFMFGENGTVLTSQYRNGCTYNGVANVLVAAVQTDLTFGTISNIKGFIFFPDNVTINGLTIPDNSLIKVGQRNRMSSTTQITHDELNNLIRQGVLFLPMVGGGSTSFGGTWDSGGIAGYFYTSTKDTNQSNYSFCFGGQTSSSNPFILSTSKYYGGQVHEVYMCRDA